MTLLQAKIKTLVLLSLTKCNFREQCVSKEHVHWELHEARRSGAWTDQE